MIWQKSRLQWSAKGDKNSKFFHHVVNYRCTRNNIIGIRVAQQWITQPKLIKNTFMEHFKNFIDCSRSKRLFKLGTITLNKIPQNMAKDMIRLFNKEEIQLALLESDSNKSPGPDGLNAACLKH